MLKVIDLEPVLYQFGNTEARGYTGVFNKPLCPWGGEIYVF